MNYGDLRLLDTATLAGTLLSAVFLAWKCGQLGRYIAATMFARTIEIAIALCTVSVIGNERVFSSWRGAGRIIDMAGNFLFLYLLLRNKGEDQSKPPTRPVC